MSRLTGNEVASLMEAYGAVYAPQQEELVEEIEQIDEADYSASSVRAAQQAAAAADQRRQSQQRAAEVAARSQRDTRRQQDIEAYKNRNNPSVTAKTNPENKPTSTSTKTSPYTEKNLGADQFKSFKAGGGDAAIKQGYSEIGRAHV